MTPAEKERADLRGPKRPLPRAARGPRSGQGPVGLVDVEVVLWQVCTECTREERVGDDEYTWALDMADVRATMTTRLENLRREVGAGDLVLCVGAKGNWRKRIDPDYKASRGGKKKPLGYWAAIDWLRGEYDVRQMDWLEADDVIGLLHTGPEFKAFGRETVVVSNDKDMLMLPGKLYDFHQPNPRVVEITPREADTNHLIRALAGDATDGYKGAAGVGEKKAAEWLAAVPRGESEAAAALELFARCGHDAEYALLQCRLARVLRHGEYDEKRKEVRLWEWPGAEAPVGRRSPASRRVVRGARSRTARGDDGVGGRRRRPG